mmetsp:Transcript_33435/g.113531  ORF Transcript_33435/g.113531 Transcript_33435/m.113531 type:complete len:214 (+) Transcript_33435:1949-2590(+)
MARADRRVKISERRVLLFERLRQPDGAAWNDNVFQPRPQNFPEERKPRMHIRCEYTVWNQRLPMIRHQQNTEPRLEPRVQEVVLLLEIDLEPRRVVDARGPGLEQVLGARVSVHHLGHLQELRDGPDHLRDQTRAKAVEPLVVVLVGLEEQEGHVARAAVEALARGLGAQRLEELERDVRERREDELALVISSMEHDGGEGVVVTTPLCLRPK